MSALYLHFRIFFLPLCPSLINTYICLEPIFFFVPCYNEMIIIPCIPSPQPAAPVCAATRFNAYVTYQSSHYLWLLGSGGASRGGGARGQRSDKRPGYREACRESRYNALGEMLVSSATGWVSKPLVSKKILNAEQSCLLNNHRFQNWALWYVVQE